MLYRNERDSDREESQSLAATCKTCYTYCTGHYREGIKLMPVLEEKQNITLRLSKETIQKARVLAAQRSTSISGLLTSQIEQLTEADSAYELAKRQAVALLETGFDLGGVHIMDRDSLHER